MARLKLSWSFPESGGAVLTFDQTTWTVLQVTAKQKSTDAEEMISVAVAELLGKILKYTVR